MALLMGLIQERLNPFRGDGLALSSLKCGLAPIKPITGIDADFRIGKAKIGNHLVARMTALQTGCHKNQ